MNFFRSEEHLRRWEGFKEKKEGGIIALKDLMTLFSRPYFKNRRDPDYYSRMGDYIVDMAATLETLAHAGEYWRMGKLDMVGLSIGNKLGLM